MSEFGQSVAVEFWTGAATALIDCVTFHSIDTLKVRAQDMRPLLPWEALRSATPLLRPVVALDSLYAGFSTNLFLKVPYMAAMFGFHALNKTLFDLTLGPSTASSDPHAHAYRELVSALLVGVEASLLLSPLELVRIQGQNCGKGGLLQASAYLAANHQPGVLLRGMDACIHREVGESFLSALPATQLIPSLSLSAVPFR